MEGLPMTKRLIEQGDFRCKVDPKYAFTIILINPLYERFSTFKKEGTIYQH